MQNKTPPAGPSAEEILQTYQRLLSQAKSNKITAWSTRTLDRALGWGALAGKISRSTAEDHPETLLLEALLENPCCPLPVFDTCQHRYVQLCGKGKLDELLKTNLSSVELCERTATELADWEISITSILKRVLAKEALDRCCSNAEERTILLSTASSTTGELLLNMILAATENDTWILEAFPMVKESLSTSVDSQLLKAAALKYSEMRNVKRLKGC